MVGIGLSEIILLLVALVFWGSIIAVLIYLVRFIIKKNQMIVCVPVQPVKDITSERKKVEQDDEANKLSINQNQKIALPQQYEIRYVLVKDVVRCEASDNYTFFIIEGAEKILISKSLKEFADNLKPYGFLRTHQSHLVNPNYVKSWLKEDGGLLLLLNGDKVPVSKPNREMVKDLLAK